MRTFFFVLFGGLVSVVLGAEVEKRDAPIGEVKEAASKLRQGILKDEGDKIEAKLKDLLSSTPDKSDCLETKAEEAHGMVKRAIETYIDPLLIEIDRRTRLGSGADGESGGTHPSRGARGGRQGDYYAKYIEERAQSAMTYAQAEADAASRWFATEALAC